MTVIEFDGVARSFRARSVLTDLSFQVEPGEVYALLGRNGAGKTTALRILLGFLEPDAGATRILGSDSRRLTGAVRERIGYVSEGHHFDPHRTVERTLDFEACTRERFDRAFVTKRVERMSLDPRQQIKSLSRGQRAQLAIIMALAGHPEVLVLDDPGLGLDAVMRRELLESMIDLLADRGATVLFSTHVFADVERLADRVGVVHGGGLIVDATLDDLHRRVERRFLRVTNDTPLELPAIPGLVAHKRRAEGFELTLVDFDAAQFEGADLRLSEPQGLSLEDLFVDLTADQPAVAWGGAL